MKKFKDCTSELSCITEREAFSSGFILATRIMVEVMQGLEEVEDNEQIATLDNGIKINFSKSDGGVEQFDIASALKVTVAELFE